LLVQSVPYSLAELFLYFTIVVLLFPRNNRKGFSNLVNNSILYDGKKFGFVTACISAVWKTHTLCPANIGFVACKVRVLGLRSHSSLDGESGFQFVHVAKVKKIQNILILKTFSDRAKCGDANPSRPLRSNLKTLENTSHES